MILTESKKNSCCLKARFLIFSGGFLKHACRACNYSHLCIKPLTKLLTKTFTKSLIKSIKMSFYPNSSLIFHLISIIFT